MGDQLVSRPRLREPAAATAEPRKEEHAVHDKPPSRHDLVLPFEQGYFVSSKISNYVDYQSDWVRAKHQRLVSALIPHLDIRPEHVVVDFGGATGTMVYEFIQQGIPQTHGTDVSYWAVKQAKELLATIGKEDHFQYYNLELLSKPAHWILALDVLEHVPSWDELATILELARRELAQGMIVRIPVSAREGENYFLEVSRNDRTHQRPHSKDWWHALFRFSGFKLRELLDLEGAIYDSPGVLCAVYEPRHDFTPMNIRHVITEMEHVTEDLLERSHREKPTSGVPSAVDDR